LPDMKPQSSMIRSTFLLRVSLQALNRYPNLRKEKNTVIRWRVRRLC
jgi:hypothetical protein